MIKWRIVPGLGFKEFESAKKSIAGVEVVRLIKKNQLLNPKSSTYKSFLSIAVKKGIGLSFYDCY